MKNVGGKKNSHQDIHAQRKPARPDVAQNLAFVELHEPCCYAEAVNWEELMVFGRRLWLKVTLANPRHCFPQNFPKFADVGLAQNFQMMKINFVDLDSTPSSGAPPHLRIIDVIKLLLRTLKQNHRRPEPRGSEAFGPVGLLPIRCAGHFIQAHDSRPCFRATRL